MNLGLAQPSGNSVGKPHVLSGPTTVLEQKDTAYPKAFLSLLHPPEKLYVVGCVSALQEGIAIVGARKATPYGCGCAQRFARLCVRHGIVVISGGAYGCDSAAHRAALEAGGKTVVFLGGGCDKIYPAENIGLFQAIVEGGGAIVSEYEWNKPALPYQFRARNRLIAGLARATLIVEAGLPSGTFSTADEALAANRDVLVVPGAITSASSRGANRLLYQGALPIVDDETFEDVLFSLFGCLKQQSFNAPSGAIANTFYEGGVSANATSKDLIRDVLSAEPMGTERLFELAEKVCGQNDARTWLMQQLVEGEQAGLYVRYPDGRWGVAVK